MPGISGYVNITAMILYQYTAIFFADMTYGWGMVRFQNVISF